MPAGQRSALGNLKEGAVRIEDERVPHYIAENDRRTSFGTTVSQDTRMFGDAIPDLDCQIAKAWCAQLSDVCHRAAFSRDQWRVAATPDAFALPQTAHDVDVEMVAGHDVGHLEHDANAENAVGP